MVPIHGALTTIWRTTRVGSSRENRYERQSWPAIQAKGGDAWGSASDSGFRPAKVLCGRTLRRHGTRTIRLEVGAFYGRQPPRLEPGVWSLKPVVYFVRFV